MKDRVYGPTFMRRFLEGAPAGSTHYLVGGSAECGAQLRETFSRLNPGLKFVGAFHGRCGTDGRLEVGFGTPKQQTWAHQHKALFRRGVVLTVGFAFDANAGIKPDAPSWMQAAGLTWLYRLVSEPRRLLRRYLKWNSLFIFYLLWDGIRGRAWGSFASK